VPRAPLSDEEFMTSLDSGTLSGFGHEAKIRTIYLLLQRDKRSNAIIDSILDQLKGIEKENTHYSINYFWIHMVDYYMRVSAKQTVEAVSTASVFSFLSFGSKAAEAAGGKVESERLTTKEFSTPLAFANFFSLPTSVPLKNSLLYEKYYSRSAVGDAGSAAGLVLPTLKQLPSVVK
jgi:hypothetical protein